MFGGTLKDILTNVVAIILVIGGAINAYLQSTVGDIDYVQLAFAVLGAIIAYFTGKAGNGKAKV
jgi:hypothetical protein